VIDGKAVFPLVLHLEWLAHAAMHGNPGLQFVGFDEVRVLNGIKLAAEDQVSLRAYTTKTEKRGNQYHVAVELRSESPRGRTTIHSRAVCVLGAVASAEQPMLLLPTGQVLDVLNGYEQQLFHGELLRGLLKVENLGVRGFEAIARSAPPPETWIQQPLRPHWLLEPLVLDCAFQAMVLWGIEIRGMPNLPCAIHRYRQYCRSFPGLECRIVARVTETTNLLMRTDFEFLDSGSQLLARIEGAEFVSDPKLSAAFRRNHLQPVVT
jgi:hypothetical protein